MVTQNAQSVANSIMAEAIERWLTFFQAVECKPCPCRSNDEYMPYEHEELVARGQVLPIAEEI